MAANRARPEEGQSWLRRVYNLYVCNYQLYGMIMSGRTFTLLHFRVTARIYIVYNTYIHLSPPRAPPRCANIDVPPVEGYLAG